MPAATKVSWAQLRVGIMAMVAMAILAVLIFLLTGSGDLLTSNATLYTKLDDSAAMASGSPVRLNGILVGNIKAIQLTGSIEKNEVVLIEMRVKRAFLSQIPDDSTAEITAANLLGDKFINITKGKSKVPIPDGGTLKAKAGGDIPELISTAGNILGSFTLLTKRVEGMLNEIDAGKGNLGKLFKDEQLYNQINTTLEELRGAIQVATTGKGTIARLLNDDSLYEDLRAPVKRIDALLTGLQQGEGTAGKLLKDTGLYDDLRKTLAEIRKTVDELNAGKGTAGKLLKDEELYRKLNALVAKLDQSVTLVNSGQGTLGQLMVNPQLYETLNGTMREVQGLMKDFRTNPKKFLRIKLGLF
ncbi:MAG: MCE family protein [Acidobacteria bacterium]|nr:MCE family protein [Acidobacteriota bacterium]MBI3472648.1 MCE family protein [Candidatus Solibacter usitatus]